jgi:uncharacterized protein YndB with AHSA1/START domain
MTDLLMRAQIVVDADRHAVWRALTDPERIAEWMNATVTSIWTEDAEISWHGEWEGRSFADHGRITQYLPESALQMTRATGSGDPDERHTLSFDLSDAEDGGTRVVVTEDNNPDPERAERTRRTWDAWLQRLAAVATSGPA